MPKPFHGFKVPSSGMDDAVADRLAKLLRCEQESVGAGLVLEFVRVEAALNGLSSDEVYSAWRLGLGAWRNLPSS